LVVDRVVCNRDDPRADLPFDLPGFSTAAAVPRGRAFHDLSVAQLAAYREHLRRHLDALVDEFDPHVIHGQHIWVQGQLTVETGVPYVLNAWGAELVDYHLDPRYQALADQAATNAGRILTPDQATLGRVEEMFELEPGRTAVISEELSMRGPADSTALQARAADALVRLYQALVDQRAGKSS
jgi:hypothetical protein